LSLSVPTVKGSLSHLFAIFEVTNRAELLGSIAELGVLQELLQANTAAA